MYYIEESVEDSTFEDVVDGKCNFLIQNGAGPSFMEVAAARGPQETNLLIYQVSMCIDALSKI